MARAVAAAIVVSLLAVSGAGGAGAQTPKRGGTVVIANTEALEPACLNPLVDSCSPGFLEGVLAGAFEVTPAGTFRPNLVASAEIAAKQPFTLLYHIRSEARWSDGTRVTAGDFVFTHEAILRHRPALDWVDHTQVRSIRALDAKTVRVVLRARNPDWRYFFPWVLPRHVLAGRDLGSLWQNAIDNPRTATPVASGPFLVERWERGRRQLVLRRNPRYWGPHPAYLDRIVYRFMPPQDTADALREGEIDMIDPGPAVLQAAALELRRTRAPGIRILFGVSNSWEHFDLRIGSGGHPALKIRLVRQALAYGIDREAIARAAGELSGASGTLEPLDSVVFLANSPYSRPSWKGYRYRPAQARRLLERAGCRTGADGVFICAGERLSLRVASPAGIDRRELTVQLVQAQLRRVGVEVIPVFARPAILFGTILPSGDFDLILFGWIQGALTAGPFDIFGCGGQNNYTGYCDRLVTRDLAQATRILDLQRRVRLLNRVDARLATAVPAIPLYQVGGLFAFKSTIRGVVPNGMGHFMWNAEDWWLER